MIRQLIRSTLLSLVILLVCAGLCQADQQTAAASGLKAGWSVGFANLSGAARKTAAGKYRDAEVLVKFKASASRLTKDRLHKLRGAQKVKEFKSLRLELVGLKKGMGVDEGISSYQADPEVEYAEPNYILHAAATPNDPLFPQLWGLDKINAPQAWDSASGNSNVVVAVLDSGIDYNHPDLAPNMWVRPAAIPVDYTDEDGTVYRDVTHGINTYAVSGDPMDRHGHGTHVAGTIGAAGNNGAGVAGVNWNVSLMACKFLDDGGYGSTSGAVECLEYVKRMKEAGVNIVATNNSYTGPGGQALYDAINAQRDILFVAAAGNDSLNNDYYHTDLYPAGYNLPNVVSVAATANDDSLAFFSNYGKHSVHIAAPGMGIVSTVSAQNSYFVTDGYGSLDGTSMAAPHVTGLAALLKGADGSREWSTIRNLILAGGDSVSGLSGSTITGRRINAYGSLSCDNRPLFAVLSPLQNLTVGVPVPLEVLSINCGTPAGAVTVTTSTGQTIELKDDGLAGDQAAGDGIFFASFTPTQASERFAFSSPAGSGTVVAPPVAVTTSILPDGSTMSAYSQALTASGGLPPYSWSLASGSLPPGLTLDPTGIIKGQPTAMSYQPYNFNVQVTDSWNSTASKALSIVVHNDLSVEQWRKSYDSGGSDEVKAAAVDSAGNIYVVGSPLIIKYDPLGNELWNLSFGGVPEGAVVDGADNLVVAGAGTVRKYTPTGEVVWSAPFAGAAHAVAASGTGVVVAGTFNDGSMDLFRTTSFDASGNPLWTATESSTLPMTARGTAVDGSGNVYVTGYLTNPDPYGLGPEYYDYTVKYDASGTRLWGKRLEIYGTHLRVQAIALDAAGNFYLAGDSTFYGFSGGTSGTSDYIAIKGSPSGSMIWERTYDRGYTANDYATSVAVDVMGNVYLAGYSANGPVNNPAANYDYLLVKYDTDGNQKWTRFEDAGRNDYATALALDGNGNIYLSGRSHNGSNYDYLTVKYREIYKLKIVSWYLPDGAAGTPYSQALTGTDGMIPYHWAVTSGSLPPGLSLDAASGVISGTPTAGGAFTFNVELSNPKSLSDTRSFTLSVSATPVITTSSLPVAPFWNPYSQTLAVANDIPPYTFSVVSGALPGGLTLAADSGVISGTPTAAGTFDFTVKVADSKGNWATKPLSITVILGISTGSLSRGVVSVPYSQALSGGGGSQPYRWSLASGTLPPGLSLDQGTGIISGTPTTAGSFPFTVKAIDAVNAEATRELTLEVLQYLPIITTPGLPSGPVGVAYSQTLTAPGGLLPYTWGIVSGALPAGLNLGASSGTISGTPIATGSFTFTVQVSDSLGNSSTREFTLQVTSIGIGTSSLPAGFLGASYRQPLATVGGKAPYQWSIDSGSLPGGLTLDPATGVLSGAPTAAGSFTFTVRLTDAFALTATRSLTMQSFAASGLYNSGGTDDARGIAVAADGSYYVAGSGSVVKYDSTGALLWSKPFAGSAQGAALDPDGNLVVAGNGANYSLLTVKYDPSGTVLWSSSYKDGGQDYAHGVAVDASGSVVVVGSSYYVSHYLAVKYLSNGVQLWAKSFDAGQPSGASKVLYGVAVDGSGSIFVTGSTDQYSSADGSITMKLDVWGNIVWSAGTYRAIQPQAIAVDGSGNIFVAGYVWGTPHFSTYKYDGSGSLVWSRSYSRSPYDYAYGVTADSAGNAYVTGLSTTGATNGGDVRTVKYDASGTVVWSKSYGITGHNDVGRAIALDRSGSAVYVAGITSTLSNGSDGDFLTVRYSLPTITTGTLASGGVGAGYADGVSGAGGTAPYSWSVSAGTLPPGLTLAAATGAISGTPTAVGNFAFTLELRDGDGNKVSRAYTVRISDGQPPAADFANSGTMASFYVQFTDNSVNAPTSWLWTFGDGATSAERNPIHRYLAPGLFTASLTASNQAGSSKVTRLITVAESCGSLPVRIGLGTPSYFPDLLAALAGASDSDALQLQRVDLAGGLVLDRDIRLTLKGGYDCGYSDNQGVTAIIGKLAVRNGSVKVENLRFK